MLKQYRAYIAAGLVVLVMVGGIWWSQKNKKEEMVAPEIVLEPTKMLDGEEGLEMPMTEEEKQQIEDVFVKEGAEMTAMSDVSGGQAAGTAWRHFDGTKFFHKADISGLASLEKGFFYEGWLVGEQGFFSTGRVWLTGDRGWLYYTADEDKSDFKGVVITLEAEDGNQAPDKHVLEGSF